MSRLTSFDLTEGRTLRISGKRYRIQSAPRGVPSVRLMCLDGHGELEISRAELASAVVTEQAAFEDELEDAEPEFREVTNLSFASLARAWDWHAKLFLLRRLTRHAGSSPKSKLFRVAHEQASAELEVWQEECGVTDCKRWTAWTCYQEILRWRRSGYQLAAIHRKGLEYAPWSKRTHTRDDARQLVTDIAYANPHLTIAQLHRQTGLRTKQLRENTDAETTATHLA